MKTMNPGCDCCGRVLIWDVTLGQFTSWVTTEEWLNEVGAEVDFAIGAPLPSQSPATIDSSFNPNVDGVDLEFWTGNANDYSLILWHLPGPQNLGGLPSWWDAVSTGTWSGRMVIVHRASFTTTIPQQLSTVFADFINGLSDRTGLQLDTSTRSRMGERLADCTRVEVNAIGGPYPETTTCEWINIPYVSFNQGAATLGHPASDVLEGVGDVYTGSMAWNPFFLVDADRVDFNIEAAVLAEGDASPVQSLFQLDTHVSGRTEFLSTSLETLAINVCPSDPNAVRRAVHYDVPDTEEATLITAARRTVEKENGRQVEFMICHAKHLRGWTDSTNVPAGFIFYTNGCDASTGAFDPIEEIDADPGPDAFNASHQQFVVNLFEKDLWPLALP